MYPSNRVRTANPVSVRVRDMVSASLSSAAVESPVLIEEHTKHVNYLTLLKTVMFPKNDTLSQKLSFTPTPNNNSTTPPKATKYYVT